MGNSNNKYLKDPELLKMRSKFEDLELQILYKVFNDLSMRDYGVVNKETFLLFFPLTGLWGERLFEKFDIKHTSHINFPEFVQGIATCCKSSEEERIKFLFSLYDTDNDGFIEKKEMVTMLYNYPKNHIKFITDELAPDKGEKLTQITEQRRRSINSMIEVEGLNAMLPKDKHDRNHDSILVENEDGEGRLDTIPEEKERDLNLDEMERDIKVSYAVVKEKELEREKSKLQMSTLRPEMPSPRGSYDIHEHVVKNLRKVSADIGNLPSTDKRKDSRDPYVERNKDGSSSMVNIARKTTSHSTIIVDQSFVLASTVNSRVKEYASFMFKTFEGAHTRGKISFEEFREWLSMHSIILRVFDDTFHQDIWALSEPNNGGIKNHFKLKYHEKKPEISGMLYKRGKKYKTWKTRYFELRDHFLFYYDKKESELPKGMLFLEGCYVEDTNDYVLTKKYGFVISHKTTSYEPHHLYCSDKTKFDEWMFHLKSFQSSSIHDSYTFQDKIGTGKFSIVYKALSKRDNKEYAIKVIDKNKLKPEEKEFLLLETSVMKVLDHPHVIKLIDTIETKTYIYIVTEIVRDGDLFDYIINNEFLEEYEASLIMKQLLNSFNYLHGAGVIHRDIKPENILITIGKDNHVKDIKIIDFGFAKFITPGTLLKETCGTPNYVAPEVLKGTGYNRKADIWSVGIIMYLMLRGQLPFDSNNVDTILKNTIKGEIEMSDYHWRNISHDGKDLLSRFLQKEPNKRIEIADALKHPWIVKREELKKYKGSNRLNKSASQSNVESPLK